MKVYGTLTEHVEIDITEDELGQKIIGFIRGKNNLKADDVLVTEENIGKILRDSHHLEYSIREGKRTRESLIGVILRCQTREQEYSWMKPSKNYHWRSGYRNETLDGPATPDELKALEVIEYLKQELQTHA